LDDNGKAIVLRVSYNAALFKYEVQAKQISIR
jgi:hypothetical protein